MQMLEGHSEGCSLKLMASNKASACDTLGVRTCCKRHPITELQMIRRSVEAAPPTSELYYGYCCGLLTSPSGSVPFIHWDELQPSSDPG